jgi:hypothetical protein
MPLRVIRKPMRSSTLSLSKRAQPVFTCYFDSALRHVSD